MKHTSATRTGVAALAASLVVVLAPLSTAGAQTTGLGPLRTTENFRLGAESAVARGRDVPGLAVDPANPNHIVEVDVDYLNGECDFHATFDGGKTWTGGHLRAPAGFPVPPCGQNFDSGGYAHGNASVVFGAGQNVYTAFSSHRGPFQRPESAIIAGAGDDSLVARSTDGGRTFQTAVVAVPGGPEAQPFFIRPQISVDPGAGNGGADRLYASAWACRVTSGGCSGGDDIRAMYVARSDDSGATWAAPVLASAPGEQIREPAQPVVGADGTVYVGWRNRDTGTPTPPNNIVVARSTDRGATWTRFNVGLITGSGGHPRLAIDKRNSNLYVAYQGFNFSPPTTTPVFAGDADIVFHRSTDKGATWSAPIRVNDDKVGNGLSQNNAWVSVAPDGRVDVVWLDRRHRDEAGGVSSCCKGLNAANGLGDIYTASSTDAGLSFGPNRRVTDRHLSSDVGLVNVGGYTWYGPVAASLDANRVMFAWTDSREGTFSSGAQDVYLATLDVRSAGATPVRNLPAAPTPALAVSLSRLAYPGGLEGATSPPIGVSKVVIVPEGDAAAATAGAVLARGNFGPLLPSPAGGLTPEVKDEVARMEAVGAFVIGNEAALSAQVVADLVAAGVPAPRVVRISGTDAADTARLIAEAMDTRSDADKAANRPAFAGGVLVANPASPEAASIATLAASLRQPVLFTDSAGNLAPSTAAALRSLAVTSTAVVGSTSSVPDSVTSQLPG
ncbi:MAG: cell wall-binding repeat-containing protein, partial [Acidimicrobiales bacterium]